MSVHRQFIEKATLVARVDVDIIGLAAGGSWITGEIDAYSDIDLILFTRDKISADVPKMMEKATAFGQLVNAFTGEHVGEPRLLICLFDDPLLHVDIKFLVPEELRHRVEDPVILFDRDGGVQQVLSTSKSLFPHPHFQWIEDRFWTWIHYAALRIGRGEYLEALDFFGYLRQTVFGPLSLTRNGQLPRGLRKVEFHLAHEDLQRLLTTVPAYDRESLLEALDASVDLYRILRADFPAGEIEFRVEAEEKVLAFIRRMNEK